jgi:phosphatidylglycerol---prolipoprotein diacylglyceryl transferase
MIDLTPDPIAIQLGPLPVYWYGICYALGLLAAYQIMVREARRRGLDGELIINGLIIVSVAALLGGRLYHVIDQWSLYKDDPLTILLPIRRGPDGGYMFAGFSGLGVYGGLLTGTIAAWLYLRWKHQSFWRWADVVAPALFAMQAIGRLGNFFNQELYGPPTTLPWGIAIQCQHRVEPYLCPAGSDPNATLGQHFQPLFLYEATSAVIGLVFLLWLGRRFSDRLRAGDLLLIFFIWYGVTRFLLEFMRSGYNWTLGGIPTAQIASAVAIVVAGTVLVVRHSRPGRSVGEIEAEERAAAEAEAAAAEAARESEAVSAEAAEGSAIETGADEAVESEAATPDEPPDEGPTGESPASPRK